MKTLRYAAASLLVALGLQIPAFAAQHTGVATADGTKQGGSAETMRDGKRKQKNAEASYRAARKACLGKQVEKQEVCLRKAKAKHTRIVRTEVDRARAVEKSVQADSSKAVQTQSAQVSATGIAPPAVDRRTPGKPASSSK